MNAHCKRSAAALSILLLAGCGDGGGPAAMTLLPDIGPPPAMDPGPEPAGRLPFPYTPDGSYGYEGLPRLAAADARHMPVYRDRSRLFVGVDQGPVWIDTFTVTDTDDPDFTIQRVERPLAAALPVVGMHGDTEVRHGRLADGVGAEVVAAYLATIAQGERGVLARHDEPPSLRVIGPADAAMLDRTLRAVQLVNAALPEESKIRVAAPAPDVSLRDRFDAEFRFEPPDDRAAHTIDVEFVPADRYDGGSMDGSSGTTHTGFPFDTYAYIQLNLGAPQFERHGRDGAGAAVALLVHELLHALGLGGHVPEQFASIMFWLQGAEDSRQPLSLLYPEDREALRALYGHRDSGDDIADFGPWTAETMRLDGNGPHANFGVALRNGYAEPWAYGLHPATELAANPDLPATATWGGALLGLTPQAEAVTGDAAIRVELATLSGTAHFTELEHWAANAAPGEPRSGAAWGPGQLHYAIAVRGNTFRETGGDPGTLTGIFVGHAHGGAAGTLERADLTAAFGASR